MKQNELNHQLHATKQHLQSLHKRSDRIAALRFASFCLAIAAAALGYDGGSAVWYGTGIAAAVSFLFFIGRHRAIRRAAAFHESRSSVLADRMARLNDQWRQLKQTGAHYAANMSPQAKDLDLLGENSLYQYLCCAHTPHGQARLADALLHPCLDAAKISARQEAVREFIKKECFALDLQTIGHQFSTSENQNTPEQIENFIKQTEQNTAPTTTTQLFLLRAAPLATCISLLLAACSIISPTAPILLLFLQVAAAGLRFQRLENRFSQLMQSQRLLQMYAHLFTALEQAELQSPHLQALHRRTFSDDGAGLALQRLRRIGECIDMRRNFIFYVLGNTLLLWDFHCAAAFADWKARHGGKIRRWLEDIGELETLISFSLIGLYRSQSAFPNILSKDSPVFTAQNLTHPLLDERKAVPNDAAFHAQTGIITGSNMSGKTTFLRAIGVNCILAYAGAPVCAARMELAPMRLFTSMRVEDDISRGISTFYAELLRIKTMVEYSEQELPMLSLIDEIFKGTNSADRIIGAAAAVKKLTKPWCITLVSTHDSELCHLAEQQPKQILNYHFSEFYQNNAIHFDYQIKPGPSQTTNAKYLLRMVGIS